MGRTRSKSRRLGVTVRSGLGIVAGQSGHPGTYRSVFLYPVMIESCDYRVGSELVAASRASWPSV